VVLSEPIHMRTSIAIFQAYHLRSADDEEKPVEGMVLSSLKNNSDGGPVLVRLQSSCLFSESFGSLDCDCALQLSAALQQVAMKEGVIVYSYEEGRGMGLASKCNDIRLQQSRGMDSMAACVELGLEVDSRSYKTAADALKTLVNSRGIILLSNNPDKENALRRYGLNVIERQHLLCGTDNPDIVRYLNNKRRIFGHDVPEL
jgi:GTP cyclohydrolase II